MLRMMTLILLVLVFGCAAEPPEPPQPSPEPPKPPEPIAAEKPDTGNPLVEVMLKPQGLNEPRRIIVGPRGVGICETAEEGVCGDTVTFSWIGDKKAGEEITIAFVESPAIGEETSSAKECFGKGSDTIKDIGRARGVTFKAIAGKCIPMHKTGKPSVAFFYTVSCNDPNGTKCGDVVPVDPGVFVESGGG